MRMFVLAMGLLALGLAPAAAAQTAVAASSAPDGPGALAHFDLARKDCLGTARNTTSRVWFTLANGVLSDVYYPTIDNTNVETLQFIVTDGSTFTDLQTRDTTYTTSVLDTHDRALDCRVTTTAKSGKYRLVTDYLTDPDQNTLVIRARFQPLVGDTANYRLYVRYDPTINGNGGGGSANAGGDSGTVDSSTGQPFPVAFDTVTQTNAANRDYAQPVFSALAGSTAFKQVSNGFAGAASDGLVQLDAAHALTRCTRTRPMAISCRRSSSTLARRARSLLRSVLALRKLRPSAPPAHRCARISASSNNATKQVGKTTTEA